MGYGWSMASKERIFTFSSLLSPWISSNEVTNTGTICWSIPDLFRVEWLGIAQCWMEPANISTSPAWPSTWVAEAKNFSLSSGYWGLSWNQSCGSIFWVEISQENYYLQGEEGGRWEFKAFVICWPKVAIVGIVKMGQLASHARMNSVCRKARQPTHITKNLPWYRENDWVSCHLREHTSLRNQSPCKSRVVVMLIIILFMRTLKFWLFPGDALLCYTNFLLIKHIWKKDPPLAVGYFFTNLADVSLSFMFSFSRTPFEDYY